MATILPFPVKPQPTSEAKSAKDDDVVSEILARVAALRPDLNYERPDIRARIARMRALVEEFGG